MSIGIRAYKGGRRSASMKIRILLLLAVFQANTAFAQWDAWYPGVPLVVGADSDVWSDRVGRFRDDNVTRRLPQGTAVLGIYDWDGIGINDKREDVIGIRYGGSLYSIRAGDLVPAVDARLPADWIRTPHSQKRWAASYYLDILRSGDRDTLMEYERPWIEYEMEMVKDSIHTGESDIGAMWYDPAFFFYDLEPLVIFDAVIIMGVFERVSFFITDIVPLGTGYKITVAGDRGFARENPVHAVRRQLPFPPWSERQSFGLIFIPDGDYMDVYLDTTGNRIATFASVDAVVLEKLKTLVWTNTVDLSGITSWPVRANGSMDFPPPEGVSFSFNPTHKTTDRLRVRENPDTASAIVITLDTGTHVQLLETGASETIGEITAPWVKVLSENGFTGWAFSGYLETLNPDLTNRDFAKQENVETQNQEAANPENPKSSFPVLQFAVTGGAVLVSGIAAIAVFAKRRKGKAAIP